MGIPVLGPRLSRSTWFRRDAVELVSTNESGGRVKLDTFMLQVKRIQGAFSRSKNPDMPVDRIEHMVIPNLEHTATTACELESKVLPRKENVIGSKIDSKPLDPKSVPIILYYCRGK